MKNNRSFSFWFSLTLFSLIGQVAWVVENMYLNVFIYKTFNASAADISAMVAASAVTATLTTVLMGALSDRLGRRKAFICGGYLLWGVSIFAFAGLRMELLTPAFPTTAAAAAAGVTLTILLDCVMTFFGSTANDAAFNAWLTDSTTPQNRGAAEGVNAMMPLLAVLVVFGGFMFLDLDRGESWTVIFAVIGVVVFAAGLLGLALIREPEVARSREPMAALIFHGFRPSVIRQSPALYRTLAAFVLFNISIQIFMPYLILYYEVSLGMENYVLIMAPAILLAAVVTALWGRLYDKRGFHLSGLGAMAALLGGYLILYFTRATLPVFVGSLLMMSGYLAGMAVFGAMIRDNTPAGTAGRLQGVRIFAQVFLPGIIGPFIGKTVLRNAEMRIGNDGTAAFVPNHNIFLAAAVAALLVLPLFALIRPKPPRTVALTTDFERDLTEDAPPFADYPRPQLRRDSYLCLNGRWALAIMRGSETRFAGEILVPFPPESRLSGIMREVGPRDTLVYTRTFTLTADFLRARTLLHFGACDQYTRVWLNDQPVGEHVGGYLPFSCDITSAAVCGENRLRVEVRDPLDPDLPYGKQTRRRGGMWYTPVSGIWQTVWAESLPEGAIESIKLTPDLSGVDLEVTGGTDPKVLRLGERTYTFTGSHFRLEVEDPILWTPDNPHLYAFTLTAGEDTVSSYFGLRTVSIGERAGRPVICLNGKPIFCHGLLDQGYFPDGIFLPASPRGFTEDIARMKACGFNMLRKHIKLEPDLFYYDCDRLGMLVFQDMINSGRYHFLIDTALPTVGLRRGIAHRASPARRQAFADTCRGIQAQLYNHPSVVYYTIFNEGWGQFDADDWYRVCRAADPTRIYDTTSGWFKARESDVESDHVYFKPVKLRPVAGRPMVLSEFGGYACRLDGHAFNLDRTYGYRLFNDCAAFETALIALYDEQILPAIADGLCATVLTQVSDVEDETNGLLTYDRRVLKADEAALRAMAERIYRAFRE
ncbi:MAG: MFS transporter [Clostridia bacterium]|nr:MFS transporter [Clostridia bacterium]